MMGDISLAELLKTTENPEQAASVLSYLEELNKAVMKIDSIISTFQKWGLSTEVVEKLAIKYAGLDQVPDLPRQNKGIQPRSEFHKTVMTQLNELDENQLADLLREQKAKHETPKK